MAKATTMKSVMLSVRVPIALHDQIKAQMEATPPPVGLAGVVVNLLWLALRVKDNPPADDTLGVLKLREDIEALTKAGAAKDAKIAELERLIAARARPVIAALRADPAMKAIDTSVHHPSGPVLKSAVPKRVRGTVEPFFKPGQRAALDVIGQAPAKGKGKR